jgi:hypothetical protein
METMTAEEMREFYNQTAHIEPPPNCELKETSPGVFLWVERTNADSDGDTTE